MRRASKIDTNHAQIVETLRARGHLVLSMAPLGSGAPDVLVGCRRKVTHYIDGRPFDDFEHVLVAIEIKTARNKRGDLEPLTPLEVDFHRKWAQWPVYVVGSVSGALRVAENATGAAKFGARDTNSSKTHSARPNVVSTRPGANTAKRGKLATP